LSLNANQRISSFLSALSQALVKEYKQPRFVQSRGTMAASTSPLAPNNLAHYACPAAATAAAAVLMLGGDVAHKIMGRPWLDHADLMSMMNPGSRQIYLTFPVGSTFREDDFSNYFFRYSLC
jgi:hypothetical protein